MEQGRAWRVQACGVVSQRGQQWDCPALAPRSPRGGLVGSGSLAHSLVVVVARQSPCPVSPDGVNVTEGDLHPHTECLSVVSDCVPGAVALPGPRDCHVPAFQLVSFQGVERSSQPWARAVTAWAQQWTGEGRAAGLAEQRVPRLGRAPDPQADPDVSTGWQRCCGIGEVAPALLWA